MVEASTNENNTGAEEELEKFKNKILKKCDVSLGSLYFENQVPC